MYKTLFTYDIFENIITYLDPISITNLLNTCKNAENVYYGNIRLINRIIIEKIFDYFNLWKVKKQNNNKLSYLNCLDLYELNFLKKQSYNIYKYFYNHKDSNIGDFLIYHIEHVCKYEPNIFFKYLVSLCDRKIYFQPINISPYKISKYKIMTNDIIYILTYANYMDFCILLEHFEIKPNMISYIIKDIINQKINKSEIDIDEKLYKCIDFYFYKFLFGGTPNKTFNLFLNHIITIVLQNKENLLIDYVMSKKRMYNRNNIELNYQMLITTAIECNNLDGLQTIWNEYLFDNSNIYVGPNPDTKDSHIIIISSELITTVCKNGWFEMFRWIVEILLGDTINLKNYISSVLDGIFMYAYSMNNDKYKNFENLLFLSNYLSMENKKILDDNMYVIYRTNRSNNKIKIIKFL